MRFAIACMALTLTSFWFTPDQQAHRLFRSREFAAAAETFEDPQWAGVSWYRAGEFEKAAQAFSLRSTAEAGFNEGNCWIMLGKYETAVECFDRALAERPDWREAFENRELAIARAKQVERTGGDMGDQKLGADDVVFDPNKEPGGEETQVAGEEPMSDAAIQAMWLRRVQTKPADFLRSKFAYQQSLEAEGNQ